jgi:hypothetical protein
MKKLRQLPEILAEYRSATKKANLNLDAVQATTRAGFATAKRQAQDALPDIKAEFLARGLKNSIAAFVVGDEARSKEFARVAASAGGTFTVDARAVFEKIADLVGPSIGRTREFAQHQAALMDQALKTLAEDTGYTGRLEQVRFRTLRIVATRDDLVDYIRELSYASNGVTPTFIAAQNQILTQALTSEFTGRVLAVTILNAEPQDRKALGSMFTKVLEARVDDAEVIDERFARNVFEGGSKPKTAQAPVPKLPEQNTGANEQE